MYRRSADACGPTILTSPFALATSAIIEMTLVSPAPGGAGPTTFGFGAGVGFAGVVVGAVAGAGGFTPVEGAGAAVVEGGAAGLGAAAGFEGVGAGGRPLA